MNILIYRLEDILEYPKFILRYTYLDHYHYQYELNRLWWHVFYGDTLTQVDYDSNDSEENERWI